MNRVASQSIGSGDEYPITQSVEARAASTRSTVAIIAKNELLLPLLRLAILEQDLDLLLDGLCQCLTLGGDPHRDGDFHLCSPGVQRQYCSVLILSSKYCKKTQAWGKMTFESQQ
jgi:hypothetical protein